MNVQVGQTVWVPSLNQDVIITKANDGIPVEGKYIDDAGVVNVVDLITTAWEAFSILKMIWSIIKSLWS